jgi:6-phosphofructokinase 1
MGRHSGWIAVRSGIAGGAEMVIIPEIKVSIDHVVDVIKKRIKRGKLFSMIIVAEGCEYLSEEIDALRNIRDKDKKYDEFGRRRLGGISTYLAEEIEKRSGIETRAVILSYIQRGGMPTAFDRVLGTRFGVYSVEMVADGKFGRMAALKGTRIIDIPIETAISKLKLVDPDYYKVAEVFFR